MACFIFEQWDKHIEYAWPYRLKLAMIYMYVYKVEDFKKLVNTRDGQWLRYGMLLPHNKIGCLPFLPVGIHLVPKMGSIWGNK